MSKTNGLPTGISYSCGSYRWCVTYKGERLTGSHKLLNQAIAEREGALMQLKYTPLGVKLSQYTTTDNRRQHKAVHDECPTLKEAFETMLATEWKDAKSIKTIKIRIGIIKTLMDENIKLYNISTATIDRLIAALDARGVKGPTINRYLSILSKTLSRGKRRGWVDVKPEIERRKESQGRIRCLTEDEESCILKHYHDRGMTRMWAVVQVLIDTGLRTGEFFKLTKKDVNFDEGKNGIVYLYDTKNSLSRVVPLTSKAKKAFKVLIETSQDADKIQHEYYGWIQKTWKVLQKKLGMENDPNFVPHILRHTCCTRLIKNNGNITKVQKWMGHRSIQTTLRYTHLAANDILNLADLLEEPKQVNEN